MCSSFMRNLTMHKQVLLYSTSILVVVIALVIITFTINTNLLVSTFEHSQHTLLLTRNKQRLDQMLIHHSRLVTSFIAVNENQLIALHQLELASHHMKIPKQNAFEYDFSGATQFPDSIKAPIPGSTNKKTYSFMCGSNKTRLNSTNPRNSHTIGFTNLLGSTGIMLNTHQLGLNALIYGAIFQDPTMVYSYPCLAMGPIFARYDPISRPWYKKGVETFKLNNDTVYKPKFTDPFKYTVGDGIGVSLTLPQVDMNNNFIGVWATDFNNFMFTEYLQTNVMIDMLLLVDKNGILIVHGFPNEDKIMPLYLHNQAITGFSQQDWDAIVNNDTTHNTCQSSYQLNGVICRFNTLYNKEQHISYLYIQKYELYLLMLSDQYTTIQPLVLEENEYIQGQMEKLLRNTVMYQLIVFIAITVCSAVILRIAITQPIHKVVFLVIQQLKPSHYQQTFKFGIMVHLFNSNHIKRLIESFNNLLNNLSKSQLKKSKQCQAIEDLNYPNGQQVYWQEPEGLEFCMDEQFHLYHPSVWKKENKQFKEQVFNNFM